ncbi:MAG: hypothetical protein BWY13_01177 [Euryarchaeota archaeon ADurb.Bin190]|nr:MAG: hypothetical protein BWY13_01177 [Euryarchaeota archaeon ADurb.Bin190]
MKRISKDVPTGIFILAGISFLQGFHLFLTALLAISTSFTAAIIDLILGAYFIICGSGLVKLKFEGWMLAAIAAAVYLLLALAKIALGGSLTAGIIDIIIGGSLLIYLNRPEIKKIFEK